MAQREINQAGVDLVKSFEGLLDGDPSTVNLDPYPDPIKIWTIGWGHVIRQDGRNLVGDAHRSIAFSMYPEGITLQQAEELLRADLLDACRDVQRLVKVPLTDNEFAALVSFTFNLGATNFGTSTLLRVLNDGDRWTAAEQFGRWVLARGVRLEGLSRRRRAERDLFITP